MEKKKRINWIDASRGFAIFGVILFHTGFLPFIQISDPLLMSWILPVFLFTGGWLLKDTPFTFSRVGITIRRLLISFGIAGAVSFLGWIFLRDIYPNQVLLQPIGGELLKWLTGRNPYFDSPLWFIPTYLFASIFMQAIANWWFRRKIIIRSICSLFFITAGFLLSRSFHYPIFSYDLVLIFIGMMMMGSVASTIQIPKFIPRVPFDVLAFILFAVLSISNGYIDIFQRQFGNELLFLICAILGTYCVARLPIQKFSGLARSSMSLLIWHWPIMQWLTYGLFASGLLQQVAANFTKISFTIKEGGAQLLVLQILLCSLYTSIVLFIIFAGKKLVYKYTTRSERSS